MKIFKVNDSDDCENYKVNFFIDGQNIYQGDNDYPKVVENSGLDYQFKVDFENTASIVNKQFRIALAGVESETLDYQTIPNSMDGFNLTGLNFEIKDPVEKKAYKHEDPWVFQAGGLDQEKDIFPYKNLTNNDNFELEYILYKIEKDKPKGKRTFLKKVSLENLSLSDGKYIYTPSTEENKPGSFELKATLFGKLKNDDIYIIKQDSVKFERLPKADIKKKTKQNKSGIYFSGDDNHYFETKVTEYDGVTDFEVDHVNYYYKRAEIEGNPAYQQIYDPPVEKFHNGQNTVYSLDWDASIQPEGYYIVKAKAFYKSAANPEKYYSSSDSLLLEIVNNKTIIVTPGNNEIHNINAERTVGYTFTNPGLLGSIGDDYQPALSITDENGVEYKDSLSFYNKKNQGTKNSLLGGYFKPGYLKPGKYRIWAAAYNNELNRFKAAPDSLNFYVPEWGLTLDDLNPAEDFYYPETRFAYQKPFLLKLKSTDTFEKAIQVSITNSLSGSEVFTTTLTKEEGYVNTGWIPDYNSCGFYKITMIEEASEVANGQNLIQSQEIQICPLYETFESYSSDLSGFFNKWEQTGNEPEIWKKIVATDNTYGFNKENSLLCSYFKTKDHIEINSFTKEFTLDPKYNFAVSFKYALEKRDGSYPPIYADYRVKASFDNGGTWDTIFEVLATEQGKKIIKKGNIASLNRSKSEAVLGVKNEKTTESIKLQKKNTKESIFFGLYESTVYFSKGKSNIKLMFETEGDPAWYTIDHPDSTWWDQHFVYDDLKIHYIKNMMQGNFLEEQIEVGSDENYTFSAGQHHIMNNIEVGTGKGEAVLTIEPGAELIFHGAHEIRIGANGKLNMKGTIDNPIKFTVDTANFVESDQYWRKIIVVLDKTADASIEYCNFDFKNKYFFRSLIESYETNVAIKNCHFTGLKSSGVVSFYGAEYNSDEPELVNLPELSKLVFVNNLISRNNSSYIVDAVSSTDLNIANNTITDCNNSTLFKTKYRSTKAKIYNNIFSENNNSNLIELSDNYQDGKHLNKKFFNNNFFKTSRSYLANDNDSITFENNVSEICFFKDNSFELSSKSNLINFGYSDEYTNLYLPDVDLNGNQRIVADKVDLGAFEFQNTAEPRYLSGYLSGTLLKSESPYLVSGDLYIRNGEFLKIEPGVKLVFLGYHSLKIDGEIEAIGTNEEPITFTAADTTGHFDTTTPQGGWNGIIINNNHNEKILFEHAIIEYVKKYVTDKNNEFSLGAITIINSYPKVKYCEIRYNRAKNGGGISYSSNVVINHNTIVHNTSEQKGSGIFIKDSNCPIRNSIIWGNTSLSESGKKGQIYGELNRSFRNMIVATFNNCLEGGHNILEFDTSYLPETSYTAITFGNIEENPLFNNHPENDFVISTSSPCIDKGVTYSYRDLDGSLPDIGALAVNGEFSGSSLVLPESVITGLAPANLSGEYKVLGTLYIPENQVLQIAPGSKIIFAENAELNVKGKIICTGTEDEPIEFRGVNNQLVWRGINIYDTDLKSVFKHSIIRDSNQGGIKLINTKAAIDNCTFTQNSAWTGGGVCSFNSDVEINDSKFVDNIILLSENSLYLGLINYYYYEMYKDLMYPYKHEAVIRPLGVAMSLFHSKAKVNKCLFSNIGGMGINIANDIYFPIYKDIKSDSVKNKRDRKNIKNTDIDKRVYFTNNLLMGNTNTSMVISEANPVVVNNTFLGDNYPIEQTEYYNSLSFSNAAVIQNNIFTGYLYAMYPYGGMVFNNNIMIDDFDLGGSNNIIADPLLLNSEEKPYLTSASSPAINTGSLEGVREYLGQLDIDGNQRVDDGAVDIGCFEHLKDLTAKFSVSSRIIQPGDSLTYVDESFGAPAKWSWDFDNDGIIDSEKKEPNYAYNEKGLKSVNLIIEREAFKDTVFKSDYILVTDFPEVVKPISDFTMAGKNVTIEIDSVFSRPNNETFTYSVSHRDSLLLSPVLDSNKLSINRLESRTAIDTIVLRADYQIIFDKKKGKVTNGHLLKESRGIKLADLDKKAEKYTFTGFITDTFFVNVAPSNNDLEFKDLELLTFAEDDSLVLSLDSLVIDENPETIKWNVEILGLTKSNKDPVYLLSSSSREAKLSQKRLKAAENVWLELDSLTRIVKFKAKENYFTDLTDSLEVKFKAKDNEGLVDSTCVKLTITPVNDAPFMTGAIADTALTAGVDSLVIDLSKHFSDVDNEVLYYAVTPDSAIAKFKVIDSKLIINRIGNIIGDTKVNITADDSVKKENLNLVKHFEDQRLSLTKEKLGVTTSFNLSVKPYSNEPFIANQIPDTTVVEDFGSVVYNLNHYFTDPNGDSLSYTINIDTNLVKPLLVDSVLFLNSINNIFGNTSVIITADDLNQNNGAKSIAKLNKKFSIKGLNSKAASLEKNSKAVVADTFYVNIKPVNDAPILIKEFSDVKLGENIDSLVIDLGKHFKDVDLDKLYFKITTEENEVKYSVADSTLTIKRNEEWTGETNITVSTSDSLFSEGKALKSTLKSANRKDYIKDNKRNKQYIVSDSFKVTVENYYNGAYVYQKIPDIYVWENFLGSIWINLDCFFGSSNGCLLGYSEESNFWEIRAKIFCNYLRLKSRLWWRGVTEIIVYAWEYETNNSSEKGNNNLTYRIPAKIEIRGSKNKFIDEVKEFTTEDELKIFGANTKYKAVSDTFNVHVLPWWIWIGDCKSDLAKTDTIEINLGDTLKFSDLTAKIREDNLLDGDSKFLYYGKVEMDSSYYNNIDSTYNSYADSTLIESDEKVYTSAFDIVFNEPGLFKCAALETEGENSSEGNKSAGRTKDEIITSLSRKVFFVKVVNAGSIDELKPVRTELGSNYPNPFNPTTNLSFNLAGKDVVSIYIYNAKGQLVSKLLDKVRCKSGYHKISWDGKDSFGKAVASGTYLYMMKTEVGNYNKIKKMIMVK